MPRIAFDVLRGLLGKRIRDPAVRAAFAPLGRIDLVKSRATALDAGFEVELESSTKRIIGYRLSRDFARPPFGLRFGPRATVRAALPPPFESHDTSDRWKLEGLWLTAQYAGDDLEEIAIEPVVHDGELAVMPLRGQPRPPDAPEGAELIGMALLCAWAAERFGLPAHHAVSTPGVQLRAREITPRTFLVTACGSTLSNDDVAAEAYGFVLRYARAGFPMHRRSADVAISKALRLPELDRHTYIDDFIGTFRRVVASPYYVPDSWDAVGRIAPILDARFDDVAETDLWRPADLGRYERAAARRDACTVEPARAPLVRPAIAPDLAESLVALVGMPLRDRRVSAALARAELPVAKKLSMVANAALGIAYRAMWLGDGPARALGIEGVWFHADGQRARIDGAGDVAFLGFPGTLPHALAFGEARTAVAARLGAPTVTADVLDTWIAGGRELVCKFRKDALVAVRIGVAA